MGRFIELQPRKIYPTNGANALKSSFELKLVETKPVLAVPAIQPDFDTSFLDSLVFDEPSVLVNSSPILEQMMQQATAPSVISRAEIGGKKKQEAYASPKDDFQDVMNSLSKNMTRLEWVARSVMDTAMALKAACLADGQHGNNAITSSVSTISSSGEVSISTPTSIFGKKHESGKHGHCEHNEDYGKCSKGCQKPA